MATDSKDTRPIAVLGLGRFGQRMAERLSRGGEDVLACDYDRDVVEQIATKVAQAVVLDVTDEAAMRSRGVHKVKAAVIGIGEDFEAAVLTTVYLTQDQVMRQTGAAVEQAAVAAASSGTVALLSYAPDTIDADLATAKSQMTGEFLTYYGKFTTDVVAPAVRDRGVKASARAVDAAVMEIRPTEAKVLVFLDQETVSRDRPEPAYTASSVIVSLAKVDGEWLISAFDPV